MPVRYITPGSKKAKSTFSDITLRNKQLLILVLLLSTILLTGGNAKGSFGRVKRGAHCFTNTVNEKRKKRRKTQEITRKLRSIYLWNNYVCFCYKVIYILTYLHGLISDVHKLFNIVKRNRSVTNDCPLEWVVFNFESKKYIYILQKKKTVENNTSLERSRVIHIGRVAYKRNRGHEHRWETLGSRGARSARPPKLGHVAHSILYDILSCEQRDAREKGRRILAAKRARSIIKSA